MSHTTLRILCDDPCSLCVCTQCAQSLCVLCTDVQTAVADWKRRGSCLRCGSWTGADDSALFLFLDGIQWFYDAEIKENAEARCEVEKSTWPAIQKQQHVYTRATTTCLPCHHVSYFIVKKHHQPSFALHVHFICLHLVFDILEKKSSFFFSCFTNQRKQTLHWCVCHLLVSCLQNV